MISIMHAKILNLKQNKVSEEYALPQMIESDLTDKMADASSTPANSLKVYKCTEEEWLA